MTNTGSYRKKFKVTNKKHGEPDNININMEKGEESRTPCYS